MVAFVLAIPSAIPSVAAATKAFPFPVERHQLANGLQIAFVPYDSPGLVAYYTVMRVGSRNEPEAGRSGYAHFFEHMMFRGTKAHPADERDLTLTKLGVAGNAFTSSDMTVYHELGPTLALPKMIALEADRFANLDYSEEAFKTEAGAILGEYAKSASSPGLKVHETMSETAFTTHTYRHTTLGYLDDIKAMPAGYAYAREFFRRYYTPDNAIVVVVGDFDKKATLAVMTKAYGDWKGKLDAAAITQEPEQKEARRAHVEWSTPTLSRVVIGWHANGASDHKSSAVQTVLADYLFGPTSDLYRDLVLGRQLVDNIGGEGDQSRDPGLFSVSASVKQDKDLAEVERTIHAAIAKLASGEVDAARLDAVRSHLKYGAILALDTADSVAQTIAVNAAATADLDYLNVLYAAVDALTAQDLVAFAKQSLVATNGTTVTLTAAAPKPAGTPKPTAPVKVGGGK